MPSKRINILGKDRLYFLTFSTIHWYYIFNRHNRWKILEDSLHYCIKNKGLKIGAYVFMLNHIHLIAQSSDLSGFILDFKRHTTRELMKNLEKTEPRVAQLFRDSNGQTQIWKPTNMPILLETEKVYFQKINYIEQNPVKKNYVEFPQYWKYSSANPNSPLPIAR